MRGNLPEAKFRPLIRFLCPETVLRTGALCGPGEYPFHAVYKARRSNASSPPTRLRPKSRLTFSMYEEPPPLHTSIFPCLRGVRGSCCWKTLAIDGPLGSAGTSFRHPGLSMD